MPRFSIVVPTYNRRDTILRSINSILRQSFGDFEVLVTDDGSTDDTASLLTGIDPRVSVERQANAGIAPARNAALRRSKGDYIAFLDSDDEWLPHHLELSHAFFERHPNEHLFSGEFWIDYGGGNYEKHFRASMDWFLPTANRIGLGGLSLPPGETDPYLRFYAERTPVGDWGRSIVEKLPYEDIRYYSGNIFEHFRWGYLLAAQSTVLSRTAFEKVGLLDTTYPIGCDFGFLALACKYYTAHMVSAPCCFKHEYADKGQALKEGHLATGATALQFARDLLRWHETLFWNDRPTDPELDALRAFAQVFVARHAIERGLTDEAIANLASAADAFPGPDAKILLQMVKRFSPPLAKKLTEQLFLTRAKVERVTRRVAELRHRFERPASEHVDVVIPSRDIPPDIRQKRSEDIPELMRLRATTHGATSVFTDRSYFDWAYVERPRAVGKPSELWLHESGGRIDGQVGVVPVELKIGTQSHEACWVFDLAVDSSSRGKGTAGALVAAACTSTEAAMAMEVTGGGKRVMLRSGWSDLGILTSYVRPIDANVVVRRLAEHFQPAGAAAAGLLSVVAGAATVSANLLNLVSEEITAFDERVDELWEKASRSYTVVVRRDSKLLNWRFAHFPFPDRYRLFYFNFRGRTVGYAVLRSGEHHSVPAGYVVDFFCEPRWTYSILGLCVQHFTREGVAAVYCLHSNPSSVAPLLALGFIPRSSGWPFVANVRRLPPESAALAGDVRNWFLTAGDADVDRPEHARGASSEPTLHDVAAGSMSNAVVK
jgi:glycosyltransferase involved in cell wall biosynthesis